MGITKSTMNITWEAIQGYLCMKSIADAEAQKVKSIHIDLI